LLVCFINANWGNMKRMFAVANLFGLIIGVAGGVLLACSLSLKTSNYRLVENEKHEVVICHDGKLVGVGYGGPLTTGDEPCPEGLGPSSAAVVETNNDALAKLGLILVIVGFALQVPFAAKDAFSPLG
jgi:hypothetical protein